MKPIAFLTMDNLDGFISYDQLVAECLASRGMQVESVSWRDRRVQWDDFEMVIIRSPWDYQHAADEFLSVLEEIDASEAILWNPIEVVRWNIRKTYLQDLSAHEIEIVPTQFIHSPTEFQIDNMFEFFGTDQIVIKPVIGAGAEHTFRLNRDSTTAVMPQILTLYADRLALLQPFIPGVIDSGETSLVFFAGQHSHSVLKTPKAGDFRVQEEYGSQVEAIQADPAFVELASRALELAPQPALYGRVDLVQLQNGRPAVMELELIEPSLYLRYDKHSAARFAAVIRQFVGSGSHT
ncbi:MAG: hypothetical protein R3C17_10970 [Planctomycetaceae bacterium]